MHIRAAAEDDRVGVVLRPDQYSGLYVRDDAARDYPPLIASGRQTYMNSGLPFV